MAKHVRNHWSVENSLHWILDVAFREDECPIANATAAANLSAMNRIALSALKSDSDLQTRDQNETQTKRLGPHDYLTHILRIATQSQCDCPGKPQFDQTFPAIIKELPEVLSIVDGPVKSRVMFHVFDYRPLSSGDANNSASRQSLALRSVGASRPETTGVARAKLGGRLSAPPVELLPVSDMATAFNEELGRPAKELHVALGALVLQQLHDLTDRETV